MINLMSQALFIHPLPSHLTQDYVSASGGLPHLIYKRSLEDVIGHGCEFQDKEAGMVFKKYISYLSSTLFAMENNHQGDDN